MQKNWQKTREQPPQDLFGGCQQNLIRVAVWFHIKNKLNFKGKNCDLLLIIFFVVLLHLRMIISLGYGLFIVVQSEMCQFQPFVVSGIQNFTGETCMNTKSKIIPSFEFSLTSIIIC